MSKDLDAEKVLEMSIIHDIPESQVGDSVKNIGSRDVGREEITEKNEQRSAENLAERLKWEKISERHAEYQSKESRTAKFVSDMNLIDMALQSLKYEKQERYDEDSIEERHEGLEEFFRSCENRLKTDKGREIFRRITDKREGGKDETLDFLLNCLDLKDEKRTGWQQRKVEKPESVADHSWNSAFLCMFMADQENVNEQKCMKMALLHDLEQAELGDIPSRRKEEQMKMATSEKERREIEAISKTVPEKHGWIEELWNEHRKMETDEAVFVEDMEQLDMALQALKYEKENRYDTSEENPHFQETEAMDEFFQSAGENIQTETARKLFKKIKREYEKVR